MDDIATLHYGLDLLNLMTLDPEEIWNVLDESEQMRLLTEMQRLLAITQMIIDDSNQDSETMWQDLVGLAITVQHLVQTTPELRALLLPPDTPNQTAPQVLTAWRNDLHAPENERRAKGQKYAAQAHNNLVLLQQAAPAQSRPGSTKDNESRKKP